MGMEVGDKVRWLCARLLEAPPGSSEAARYSSELKIAAAELATQEKAWNEPSERDTHQDQARQPYRSREGESANGFAEGLKLFNSKKQGTEKKKD